MNPIDVASKVTRVERAIRSLTRSLIGGVLALSAGLYFHFPTWLNCFLMALTAFLLGLRSR